MRVLNIAISLLFISSTVLAAQGSCGLEAKTFINEMIAAGSKDQTVTNLRWASATNSHIAFGEAISVENFKKNTAIVYFYRYDRVVADKTYYDAGFVSMDYDCNILNNDLSTTVELK